MVAQRAGRVQGCAPGLPLQAEAAAHEANTLDPTMSSTSTSQNCPEPGRGAGVAVDTSPP